MKRFVIFIFALFTCAVAYSETINLSWYVDNQVYQTTTCETGGNVTPPTAPNKKGYTFQEWLAYTPIEYLESTGTQWIDTGVVPNINMHFVAKFLIRKLTDKFRLLLSWESNCSALGFLVEDNRFTFEFFGLQRYNSAILNQIYEIEANAYIDNPYIQINGTKFSYSLPSVNCSLPKRSLQSLERSEGFLYYLQIYDNDILVRDFIPVLDLSGIPCMYDKVTNQFFYNQGTGQFIAGPVLTE